MSRPNRRRAVRAVAPVAGLLAAGLLVWQGSYAAFTATTVNPGNAWATGSVVLTDDDTGGSAGGTAMFSTAAVTPVGSVDTKLLKPGDTKVNCIKVTNNGTLSGPVKFYVQPLSLTQTNGLAAYVDVTVEEGTGGGFGSCAAFVPTSTVLTSTALSLVGTTFGTGSGSLTALAGSGGSRVYRITTTIDAATPNTSQSGAAGATFQWEIQA